MINYRMFAFAATALTLTACTSGEPTSSEIEQALRTAVKNAPKPFFMGNAKPGEGFTPLVLSARKLGCTVAKAAPGWNCDYEVHSRTFGREETVTKVMRFFRTDQGFAVAAVA